MGSASLLAVMAVRNEAGYIEIALDALIAEGVEVVLLDNGSIDGTVELASAYRGRGLIRIDHLPWHGQLDLRRILEAKRRVFEEAPHEWLMHVDADEWHRAVSNVTLTDLLATIEPRYRAVNFDEFVFLPPDGVDMWGMDFRAVATDYYFFAPTPLRRMKLWRSGYGISNVEGAGHHLAGIDPEAVYPQNLTMRHYMGLSWSHAISKRADRSYPEAALARGWHGNRLDMRFARRRVRSPYLRTAKPWDTRQLDRSSPSAYHFWEEGFSG